MQDKALWKRKAIEILYGKCFKRLMQAHCCMFRSKVTMKRKEKRQKNFFQFVPIKCKCLLFRCEHHCIGFGEHCFPEFKMQQSMERNCSSDNQTLKKKFKIKSKYIWTTTKNLSIHILEIKRILFQIMSKKCPACLLPAFSQ